MIKLSIEKIEQQLNKKIRRNICVLAFDSSQHGTGVSIIKTTDKFFIIKKTCKFDISNKLIGLDGIDSFIEYLDDFKKSILGQYKINDTVIEDVYVGFNPKTAICLARVGILVYDRFKNISVKCYFKRPTSARTAINFKKTNKKVKGTELKKELLAYINKLLNCKIEDDDIGDSLILALSGAICE